MSKPKAYSYLRFSTPEQQKGDSLRRQTQAAEEYCRRNGLELDTELNLRDLGVSAFRGDNIATGALGEFLKAAQQGIVSKGSFLLVESLDRISRDTAYDANLHLQNIIHQGVTVVTLMDGRAYSKEALREDPLGIMYALIVFMRANDESRTKSNRMRAAWQGKRLKMGQRALTKMTPAWITLDADRKPVLIEERAKVVRRIVKDFMRGIGKPGIAKALNTEGVPPFSARAKQWHWSYMTKILNSPALAGVFVPHVDEYRDGRRHRVPLEPVPNYFPSVLDADTYERLQGLLGRSPLRGRHAKAPVSNLLSGLARCPLCEGSMTRVNKGPKNKPFYACAKARSGAGCKYRGVGVAIVEDALFKNFEHILREMPHPDAQLERDLRNAENTVDALKDKIAELMGLLERRPSDTLARRVAELEVALREAEQELEGAAARAVQAQRKVIDLKAHNLGVSMRARPVDRGRINAGLRELLDRVVIDYLGGYLRFHWRAGGTSDILFMWPEE